MSISLLIIDPQNDFCSPDGALYVPGSEKDCERLSIFIKNNASKISSIHVTMDTHPYFHIAHPVFWRDADGKEPPPYTSITNFDFEEGRFKPAISSLTPQVENYLIKLESQGKHKLTLWPPHCLIGTSGHNVNPELMEALHFWEKSQPGNIVDYIFKGKNPLTEHYSAIQAEVVDVNDAETRTNFALIDELKKSERIIVAGQALSHCVKFTLNDLFIYIPQQKITLLRDCTSIIREYEREAEEFVSENSSKGMVLWNHDHLL